LLIVVKAAGDGTDTKVAENVSELEQVLSQWKGQPYNMFCIICHSYHSHIKHTAPCLP